MNLQWQEIKYFTYTCNIFGSYSHRSYRKVHIGDVSLIREMHLMLQNHIYLYPGQIYAAKPELKYMT